jgi:hypothetical protein
MGLAVVWAAPAHRGEGQADQRRRVSEVTAPSSYSEGADRPVDVSAVQPLLALVVGELKAEAGGVVEAGSELGWRSSRTDQHAPVLVVAVGIGDEGVQDQVGGEERVGVIDGRAWRGHHLERTEGSEHGLDGITRHVTTPMPVVVGVVAIKDLVAEHQVSSTSDVAGDDAGHTAPGGELHRGMREAQLRRDLRRDFLRPVIALWVVAVVPVLDRDGLEQPGSVPDSRVGRSREPHLVGLAAHRLRAQLLPVVDRDDPVRRHQGLPSQATGDSRASRASATSMSSNGRAWA